MRATTVPYERFVVRISEDDFLKNPNLALDAVKKTFLDPAQPTLLQRMRGSYYASYLLMSTSYACVHV